MCLRVYANGNGRAHVSVFAYLVQGEFDDDLKWPFQGHVAIQLCDQLQDKYHRGLSPLTSVKQLMPNSSVE